MKRYIYLSLFSSLFFVSCNNDHPKDILVKKWRITKIDNPPIILTLDKSDSFRIANGTLEFTKDGKMIFSSGTDADTSTYTLSDDGKTMNTQSWGKTKIHQVNELSKSKLVFTDTKESSTITAVPK